jgi:hypothetical protein
MTTGKGTVVDMLHRNWDRNRQGRKTLRWQMLEAGIERSVALKRKNKSECDQTTDTNQILH